MSICGCSSPRNGPIFIRHANPCLSHTKTTSFAGGTRDAEMRNPVYREIKEQGYPGGDSNIVRFFGHLRKHFNQSGTFKEVDPATQTPVQAPPKRPPTASQVAHWITFKEEQRLDWQEKYL